MFPSKGVLYLKEKGSIDFEDPDISNNYTLAVMADGVSADLVTIMVVDVNEAPTFPDKLRSLLKPANRTRDDFIGLYVLESALVDDFCEDRQGCGW